MSDTITNQVISYIIIFKKVLGYFYIIGNYLRNVNQKNCIEDARFMY